MTRKVAIIGGGGVASAEVRAKLKLEKRAPLPK